MVETFDALLKAPGLLILPGAQDALSARIAVRSGARAVYMTGFGVVGASFGVPDIGLIGPEAMIERVTAIASAIAPVALVADGDNGHGGPLNAGRLASAYERAGAQAIQLEDQVSPKRCGHMDGKEIVGRTDAAAKIRAAVSARGRSSFKIVARTDAIAVEGLDEALRRGEAFLAAGADVLFIEAPRSESEMRKIGETFKGVPLLANLVEDGKTPWQSHAQLEEMGFKIALYPVSAILAASAAFEKTYARLLAGQGALPANERASFQTFTEIVGLDAWKRKAVDAQKG